MKTVLITGCSSGFGLETARQFLDRGWNVIATMREPRADLLPASERLRVLPLDIIDAASIERAVAAAGPIDVLVNNAGVGLRNAFEVTPMERARALFETNTLGTMAVTQAVLPQFRERGSGVVINVTSSVTLAPLPLLSVYTATKAAVNAWSECLELELDPFGVRVHVVLPGRAPETSFGQNARSFGAGDLPATYAPIAQRLASQQASADVTHAQDVVDAIWRAATDPSAPLRIPAGADAVALAL